MTNEKYTLTIKDSLLRPGMELQVGPVSKKYAAQVVKDALDIVRDINTEKKPTSTKTKTKDKIGFKHE